MSSSIPTPTKFDDKFGSVSESYKNFRTTYNDELYSIIDSYCDEKRDLAIDIGAGSGQATVKLAKYFKKVIGKKSIKICRKGRQCEYRLSAAEKIDLPTGSVDLITVATAVHWFNLPVFYEESKRLLRENGSLIIWCYNLFEIKNDESQKIFENPHQTKHIQNGYADIKPTFDNTIRKNITVETLMPIDSLIGMISSLSSYLAYIKEGNKDVLPDFKQSLMDILKITECNSKVIEVKFPIYIILSKNRH
ncbi:hypothetical protein ACTFIZ_004692 [Dictyostelium cf. discoideum]